MALNVECICCFPESDKLVNFTVSPALTYIVGAAYSSMKVFAAKYPDVPAKQQELSCKYN